MKTKNTSLKTALGSEDDFLIFLAQEAGSDEYQKLKTEAENSPHPSDDMLYDYVLGVLNDMDADVIRDHISLCGWCAEEVLQIRLAEEDLETLILERAEHRSLWEKIMIWVSEAILLPKYLVPAAGLMTACLMILFLWRHNISQLPEMSVLMNESYQMVLSHKMFAPDNLNGTLRLPWESPAAFGFGTSSYYPAIRAFGAGLWKGRDTLSEKKGEQMPEFLSPAWQNHDGDKENFTPYSQTQFGNWTETSWEPYFSMGKILFLIRTACLSDKELPYCFWEKQDVILGNIHKNLLELPENMKENIEVIHATLTHIRSVLKASNGNSPDRKNRRVIAFELDNFITYMGPRYIPE